jgi:hypothetical protein
MTLLDRFRTQARDTHPDPAVRQAFVLELPMDQSQLLASFAQGDEDPRVRKAAVGKLMDPNTLAAVVRTDADEGVRAHALGMLRDIALEAFEGIGEAESVGAVQVLQDPRTLAAVAKGAPREAVARAALVRLSDPRSLGSIARHASHESIRRDALDALADSAEILNVALNGEFKDAATAAVERISDRAALEDIANRSKNKNAARRARALLREIDDQAVREAAAAAPAAVVDKPEADKPPLARASAPETEPPVADAADPAVAQRRDEAARMRVAVCERLEQLAADASLDALEIARSEWEGLPPLEDDALETQMTERFTSLLRVCERRHAASQEAAQRIARLGELAEEAARAASIEDLSAARRQFAPVRREWAQLSHDVALDPAVASRYAEAESAFNARDAAAHEQDQRSRREALGRIQQLIGRVESLAVNPDAPLKAAERAVRDIRTALGQMPQLPSKADYEDALRRLKAAQTALTPKVQELREIADWQRWANIGIQEQLCEKMEALASVADPAEVGRLVRDLQQQWRQAADVPRAQGDALWKRFKAAHDAAWQRCEAHFAEQEQARSENLAKKVALCERVEALADSSSWIQTADEIKRLQGEWKTIGPVSRGQEKAIWERFRSACDRFFTRRQADLAQRKAVWSENLAKKEALCVKAEELAQSTDWDKAAAEIKRLQNEWKAVGPVKRNRSEAIWQRFRGACDTFFTRYAQRHDVARAERVAAREAICAELEQLLASADVSADAPTADAATAATPAADVVQRVRGLRSRWQQELAARGVDRERAAALDQRFAAGMAGVTARFAGAFSGTDLDPDANRRKMEMLVTRLEDLAASLAGREADAEANLSPTDRLAAMLKEALASNTIGGKVDEDSRWRAAAEDVRQAQGMWSRIGPVPEDMRRPLAARFDRACRQITDRAAGHSSGTRRS